MHFFRDSEGSFSVITAFSLIPLMAFVGVAVDYTRLASAKSKLQAAADAAALAGAAATSPDATARVVELARANLAAGLADPKVKSVSVDTRWLSPTDFETTTNATLGTAILSGVPGMPKSASVATTAVARLYQPILVSQSPKVTQLDPEAADYNVISVYCFNPSKKNDPTTKGRSKFTVIADNAGTKYTYTMPSCAPGETISYRLKNVRNMRTTPSKWNDPKVENYSYFTDTTIEGYRQTHNLGGVEILETVLCDTESVCKPTSQGGVLPSGKNRTPQQTTSPCDPGKFMYFGWEDRPPGAGWTDRDYDDIRIVVSCPTITKGAKQVALIK